MSEGSGWSGPADEPEEAHESEVVPPHANVGIRLLEGESKAQALVRLFGKGPYDGLRGLALGHTDEGLRWLYESAAVDAGPGSSEGLLNGGSR
jgi:hypothetical protein